MMDLLQLVAQWALSPIGLALLLAAALLTATAVRLSPARRTGRFLLVPLILWAAFSLWSALDSSSVRSALAGVLWAFAVAAVFTVALAPLVAKGKSPRTIVAMSVAVLALQLPFSLLSGLFFGCYVGHDCP